MGKELKINVHICLYNKDMQKNVKGLIHWLLGELEIEWIETKMGMIFTSHLSTFFLLLNFVNV